MDFTTWYEQADIPVKRDEVWYDDETGMAFVPAAEAKEKADQRAATEQAATARKAAKALGGKALQGGTGKQKKWAEELRAGVLANLTPESAKKVLKQFQFRNTTWWIENRASFSYTEKLVTAGKTRTVFLPFERMEAVFERHFDRPRIVAFQKPLREVFERFESRIAYLSGHPFERKKVLESDKVLIADCKKVLATDCTDLNVFDGLMTRLIARADALDI